MSSCTGSEISNLIFQIKMKCITTDEKIRKKTYLSPAEYRAITLLRPDETVSGSEFSELLELSPSRCSRIITKMQEDNIIFVNHNKNDKRIIEVGLTERGIKINKQIINDKDSCNSHIEQALSFEDREQITESLKKLLQVL